MDFNWHSSAILFVSGANHELIVGSQVPALMNDQQMTDCESKTGWGPRENTPTPLEMLEIYVYAYSKMEYSLGFKEMKVKSAFPGNR
jgi:hypothetical protein